jgi:hypothetical protein
LAGSYKCIKIPNGIPCILPDGLVNGVFKSACASTHIIPTSGFAFNAAATVPNATLWSPPNIYIMIHFKA